MNLRLKVFTIVVPTSGDKHQVDIATLNFDPEDRHGRPLGEIPHKTLYLCPKYVSDDTPEPYREWLLAIQDSFDEQVDEDNYHKPEIQEIFDLIQKDKTTPQEYARMKDEYSLELLMTGEYKKGIEQGIEQGIHKGLLETARNMLAEGFDDAVILKLTQLSPDTLATLKK